MSWSLDTTSLALSSSTLKSRRCLALLQVTSCSPACTSSGPRMLKSIARASCRPYRGLTAALAPKRMVVRKRSDTHYEEAHMSRIATLPAVLTMIVAPAAFAGPVDLRSPDARDAAGSAAVTQVDLRSPDAVTPVQITASGQDLR